MCWSCEYDHLKTDISYWNIVWLWYIMWLRVIGAAFTSWCSRLMPPFYEWSCNLLKRLGTYCCDLQWYITCCVIIYTGDCIYILCWWACDWYLMIIYCVIVYWWLHTGDNILVIDNILRFDEACIPCWGCVKKKCYCSASRLIYSVEPVEDCCRLSAWRLR